MTSTESPVWFITGCSTGFGRELARLVLQRGYRTVVTARNLSSIADLIEGYAGQALPLKLDVTDPGQVDEAVKKVIDTFGQIDVLVNNAGIGYFAAVEESEETEVRRMFEINLFGLARMMHAVLPGMRERRSGHIINISSIAGLRAFPAMGYYCASKFAVEGLTEALWREVRPLGIKVTIIEPGPFRTDWAGRSANESPLEIADYTETAGANRHRLRRDSGKQPGDPARAAEAILKAVESPNSPLRLLLGELALTGARDKINLLQRDFDSWEETTMGADFPKN